jgi:hypothetical protein
MALQQIATRQFRSAQGKIRFDFGLSSLITDPVSQIRMLIDHERLEVRMLTAPGMPAIPGMPQMPGMELPAVPGSPIVNMVQLGKSVVEGLEAEGMMYVFQALDPLHPPPITSWEVWTSVDLQVPILTKTVGAFGQRINVCKCTASTPPESMFEIPPGYRVIPADAPSLPSIATPQIPSAPAPPQSPALPSLPATPKLPKL